MADVTLEGAAVRGTYVPAADDVRGRALVTDHRLHAAAAELTRRGSGPRRPASC